MGQEPLFYDNFRESVRHLIATLGGPKKVAFLLRPALDEKQGRDWINDCLNPDRVTKFDFEEISKLMAEGRKQGVHCAINQLCSEAGYSDPEIAPQKTARQQLAEEMQQLAARYSQLADEDAAIQKSELMAEIRAVK